MKPCSGCGNEYLYMNDEQFKEACEKDKARESKRKLRPTKPKRVPRVKGSRKGSHRRTR